MPAQPIHRSFIPLLSQPSIEKTKLQLQGISVYNFQTADSIVLQIVSSRVVKMQNCLFHRATIVWFWANRRRAQTFQEETEGVCNCMYNVQLYKYMCIGVIFEDETFFVWLKAIFLGKK